MTEIETYEIEGFTFFRNLELLTLRGMKANNRCKDGFKSFFHFRFRTLEELEDYQARFLVDEAKKEAIKKEKQKKIQEAQKSSPVKVGDIFYDSWGYEQTNINFYEVVEVLGKSVKIREVRQERNHDHGYMSGTTVPLKGEFLDSEPILKRVLFTANNGVPSPYLKSNCGWCSPYDGRPKSYSSYA